MSNRIQPTHFVKVWIGWLDDDTHMNYMPRDIKHLQLSINYGATPVALFLIREKTPQEKANSIYYPLNEQV